MFLASPSLGIRDSVEINKRQTYVRTTSCNPCNVIYNINITKNYSQGMVEHRVFRYKSEHVPVYRNDIHGIRQDL